MAEFAANVDLAEHDFPTETILNEDGTLSGSAPDLPQEKLLDMYRWMVISRTFDQRAVRLQRQGRIGTYAPFSGQEAAQIGSFAALQKTDWVCPSYRELAGLMYHGFPPYRALLGAMGHPAAGFTPEELNVLPVQIVIADQLLHAVGIAWAHKLQGKSSVAATYFGDGSTSEGDFHEALNFASVFQVPAVFFCQNNQWAISVPVERQMSSRTIAQKALAYGMPGIRVDGNDLFAVYNAMQRAVEHARSSKGPTLIEAVTYRLGAHTTADDPTRYRSEEVQKQWEQRDPIGRLRRYLEREGLWDDALEQDAWQKAQAIVEDAVKQAESLAHPDPATVFDSVYAARPVHLEEQRAEFARRMQRELGGN